MPQEVRRCLRSAAAWDVRGRSCGGGAVTGPDVPHAARPAPAAVRILHANDRRRLPLPRSILRPRQRGVLILDNTGDVVWFRPTTPHTAMNFRTAVYKGDRCSPGGKDADRGLGRGEHVIVDASYREIARFPAGAAGSPTCTSSCSPQRGTALVTSYEVRTMDTTAFGGERNGQGDRRHRPGARVPSGAGALRVEEPRPRGGRGDARRRRPASLDYFHVNSIDVDGDGDLLISARNTGRCTRSAARRARWSGGSAARRATSRWGRAPCSRGSTTRATRTAVGDQDLRRRCAPAVQPQSRALVIALDTRIAATLVGKYAHKPGRRSLTVHGQRPVARERQRARRLGQRAVRHRIRPERRDPVRRASCRTAAELQGVPIPVARSAGGQAAARPRRGGTAQAVRELERRDRGRVLAAAAGPSAPGWLGSTRFHVRASKPRSTYPPERRTSRWPGSARRKAARHVCGRSGVRSRPRVAPGLAGKLSGVLPGDVVQFVGLLLGRRGRRSGWATHHLLDERPQGAVHERVHVLLPCPRRRRSGTSRPVRSPRCG